VNIALFGGTFDPIHSGHLRAAKAAASKFGLAQVLFVPSAHPPHKHANQLTPFPHRFAMVALACARDPRFIPSLLEAPARDSRPQYSVTTVERVKRSLGAKDRLFFLMGVDAFLDLPQWKDHRRLLDMVDFIVVSRPGFDARKIWSVLPLDRTMKVDRESSVRATTRTRPSRPEARHAEFEARTWPRLIRLRQTTLHILEGVRMRVASRDIREAIRARRRIAGLVPPVVEKYILKEGLYGQKAAGRWG
jgi:nicotinate-nucleotide adenylyltransferase